MPKMFGLVVAIAILSVASAFGAETVLVEAESFADTGGWVIDQQFMDQMGSPYLLAHGLGEPVADAVTTVRFPGPGKYRVWVRTRDWVAPWNAPGAPGRFQLFIDGRPVETTFGTQGAEWHWQDGGNVEIEKETTTIALHDLTGFEGRCDAIVFSADANAPPNEGESMRRFRRKLLGLGEKPADAGTYDLVVVGGGMAGTCASLSAARLGLKVALIQDRPVLGGNNSSEVRVHLGGKTNFEPYPAIGDIVAELDPGRHGNRRPAHYYNDEKKLRVVWDEPNIDLYLNTRAFALETTYSKWKRFLRTQLGDKDLILLRPPTVIRNKIFAVIAGDIRTGRELRFEARLFADCTGDGTIGYLAGADFDMVEKGRMGPSNLWRVEDMGKPVSFARCPWAIDLSDKPFPGRPKHPGIYGDHGPQELGGWFWESGFYHDPFSKAEYIRDLNFRAMYGAWDTLKNVDKVYPNHKLVWAAYIAGKRESRRLLGDILLNTQDLMSGRRYEDGCVPTSWDIDVHLPEVGYADGLGEDAFISRDYHTQYDRPFWIPYRCLYSRNIENLFMAGRDISVTHEALGTVRVMRTCGMMGEVVGMAASLCKNHTTTPRRVYDDYLAELKALMARGVGKDSPAAMAAIRPIEFDLDFDMSQISETNALVGLSSEGTLNVYTQTKPWPGVNVHLPSWDLTGYKSVCVDVTNRTPRNLRIWGKLTGSDSDRGIQCSIGVPPGKTRTLRIDLYPTPWKLDEPMGLVGMRRPPGEPSTIDVSKVTNIFVHLQDWDEPTCFEVDNVRAVGRLTVLKSDVFLPFIDEFGQFAHADWPGKTHSQANMELEKAREKTELGAKSGPDDWDKYGGYNKGPKLEATGFFRVEKYNGKWWLIDPAGFLFWSHGVDCVRSRNETPISDRQKYFAPLPGDDSPFAEFYDTASWAPHGYYKDHTPYKTFDFSRANFLRKYGDNWQEQFADVTHRRLRSWGTNTIANWSDEDIYLIRRTPYVATINFDARRLEGSEGYWGKFYDVFDDSFTENLAKRLEQEKGKSIGDPWCVGFFVHNELAWGDEVSLSLATLASPAEQPAKKVFVEDLKAKYGTIDKLNAAWSTHHKSWEQLLKTQQLPPNKEAWAKDKAQADLTAFYIKTAETYFATVRDELKRVAPQQLYLGCRFAWVNDLAANAAAKYCDVVGYNRYEYDVEGLALPGDIDKPIIIGEFHFGALDRGMFHEGLRPVCDQQDRAFAYKHYVESALRNPYIVGTHWFQYKDQATTGRGDGENYQIGLIDICDTPYPETIQALRQIGYNLYEYRVRPGE